MTTKQKENATVFFETHPKINEVIATEDGELFLVSHKEDAKEHARKNEFAKPVTITRAMVEAAEDKPEAEVKPEGEVKPEAEKQSFPGDDEQQEKINVELPVGKKLPDFLIDQHKQP